MVRRKLFLKNHQLWKMYGLNDFLYLVFVMDLFPVYILGLSKKDDWNITCTDIQDRAFQYIWNFKEYLDKVSSFWAEFCKYIRLFFYLTLLRIIVFEVSRVVLATDGDSAGQALGEELVRRLGKRKVKNS